MSNAVPLLAKFTLFVGFIAAAMIAAAGPAYRFAGVELGTAFDMLKWGLFVGIGAAAIAALWLVVALISRSFSGVLFVIIGLALAWGGAAVPLRLRPHAQS